MLLEGKRILITGVLTQQSIAYAAAEVAQEHGAELILTSFGRAMTLPERVAKPLPSPPDILEMDVNEPEQIVAVREELDRRWGRLDGFLHAIAFAPQDALGGNFLHTPWDSVATAIRTSAYSLKDLAVGMLPLMEADGGAIVALDFDARVAWPIYDWMGVAKAGLESCARYLARDLGPRGIRVNLVSAGPLRTMAAKSIPGFAAFEDVWPARAPLGWKISDPEPAARACVALLSDWFPATTGEIVHADGGVHAVGG